MSHPVVGQRWLSEAEPELGLGLVVAVDRRRVELRFPASGETRIYAVENAPLQRVRFDVGDSVSGADGKPMTVTSVEEQGGVRVYGCGKIRLPESELRDTLRYDKPENRLLNGQSDGWRTFDLRLETHRRRHEMMRSPARGFLGGRVDLIPHQLFIAHEVSRREAPRVLLADEVGLGKTIEAGLILHRLLISGRIGRVIVVVPEPLIHQWFVELLRRFALSFRIYNEERCGPDPEDATGPNPFLDEQLVLCGISFLKEHAIRAAQAASAGWDLMIVDEAHHLRWSPDAPSSEYLLVEALARSSPGLLLLTATPEQLGLESHFARLRLLDPNRYPDFQKFKAERAKYESVARKTHALVESGDEKMLQELLDRHGPGRVMFRNTRAAMPGFPKRHLHAVALAPAKAGEGDPRVRWLADFLRRHKTTKALAICQTREEAQRTHDALERMIKVKTAFFHEEMTLLQCDRQAAWFAEPDGARLLIASEIGGEGRNFQFVQHLVLMDLPEDPEQLEQRIGRLDRIGQSGDIHIHVPFVRGTREEGRLRWFHEGLNAFEEPISGSHEILLKFEQRLNKVTPALIRETQKFRKELKARIERGRDRLLELSSFRPAVAERVRAEISAVGEDRGIEEFLFKLFDHFGVHAEHLSGRDYLLVPGHTFDTAFPLGAEPLRITCDRKQALAREDISLMSWDHAMLNGGMDLLLGSEKGNSSFAVAENIEGFLLEAVFVAECVAPPKLEAARFFPPTPIQIRLRHDGREAAERPPRLRDLAAGRLPEALADRVPELLERARALAEAQLPKLRKAAAGEMKNLLGGELERLRALRKVNDHVRPEEIAALEQRVAAIAKAIGEAAVRLDAVMVVAPGGVAQLDG